MEKGRKTLFLKRWISQFLLSSILYFLLWSIVLLRYSGWQYCICSIIGDLVSCAVFTTVAFAVDRFMGKHYPNAGSTWKIILTIGINFTFAILLDLIAFGLKGFLRNDFNVIDMYIICLISTFLAIIHIQQSYQETLSAMRAEQDKIRLSLLQQQLSPHFIFNSLSTLKGLVKESPSKATEYIGILSNITRYITKNIGSETVEVSEAMSYMDNYSKLQAIRFPGHFNITIDDSMQSLQGRILPLSLQISLENAIKHNQHSSSNPLNIRIKSDGDCIIVENDKRPIKNTEGLGIGLENLSERYRITTNKAVTITESDDTIAVRLPIIKQQK